MSRHDVIVIGLGAHGAAITYQLAKRGVPVLGVDRFAPPHTFGSSHGGSRITRLAIGEGEQYVPFVRRSHELWRELEQETRRTLITVTGGLVLGRPGTSSALHGREDFAGRTAAVARAFGVQHELLNARDLRERFPQFNCVHDEIGYYEPDAGVLHPEHCVEVQLRLARKHGAHLGFHERVLSCHGDGDGVEVVTDRQRHNAGQAVLAVGPWLPSLLSPGLGRLLRVYRQVMYWFDVAATYESHRPGVMPVFIWDTGDEKMYGAPALDGREGGVKVAAEELDHSVDPDGFERNVDEAAIERMYRHVVRDRFPGVGPACIRAQTCMYTCSPDFDFVVDRDPERERVLLVSACSGHGFKHSAAIGEAVAQLLLDGASALDLSGFGLARLSPPSFG